MDLYHRHTPPAMGDNFYTPAHCHQAPGMCWKPQTMYLLVLKKKTTEIVLKHPHGMW